MAKRDEEHMTMDEILESLRKDARRKKFKTILEVAQKKLDPDRDRKEALALHASRSSRSMYGAKQYSAKAVWDASAKDLGYRARMVEIRVQCDIQKSYVDEAVKAFKGYILTEYRDELSGFKTQAQKSAVLNRIVAPAVRFLAEIDALVALLDNLIKDIDQANFHLSRMTDVLKLLDSSKGKVI